MVQCEEAASRGDTESLYRSLRKLEKRGFKKAPSDTKLTKELFKEHFERVGAERFKNSPEDVERAVDGADDLRGTEDAVLWRGVLERLPDKKEVEEEMRKMRDSAPGEDGVRLKYLLRGGRG